MTKTASPAAPLSLAHLRTFRLVAQTGSASRAAAALFRAQSAITRAIQELEAAVGTPLLERKHSGMLPTAVGHAVLACCQRIFAELEELAQWCAAQHTRRRGLAPGTLPAYLLNARRLQLFAALSRHRHMPTTAAFFGISQPAVSGAIRTLESGSCLALFVRSARGTVLTAEGGTFLLHVRRVLNELRHIPDVVAELQGMVRGTVTVGALPLGRTLILPAAIAALNRLHPGVRVVTDESAYATLVAGLRAGDIDFILGALRPCDEASGLKTERLMSEEMVVLARAGHPLVERRGLTMSDVREAQWILPRSHAPARALFESQFQRAKLKAPAPVLETADLAIIRGLLLKTDMLAALSAQQLFYECRSGQLAVLDLVLQGTRRDVGLTVPIHGAQSPAARSLIEMIRASIAEVVSTTQTPLGPHERSGA
ncbi:MAG: LysR family transcriptional regulator [Janthinobacterium lividum]